MILTKLQKKKKDVQFGLKFRKVDVSKKIFDVVIDYPKPTFSITSIFNMASPLVSTIFSGSSYFLPKVTQTLFHAINEFIFEEKILPVVNSEIYEIKDSAFAKLISFFPFFFIKNFFS